MMFNYCLIISNIECNILFVLCLLGLLHFILRFWCPLNSIFSRNFQLCPFFSHHMKACCHTDPSARSEMTKHYPHFMF